jgi:type IV pilus assembly protein PilW
MTTGKPIADRHASRARGLSLIELMIAIAIGMVIVAALLALFVNVTRTNNEMAKMNGKSKWPFCYSGDAG